METKIDIAAILKDKPKNTKLYSPLFGYVYFLGVEDNIIKVTHRGKLVIFFGDGSMLVGTIVFLMKVMNIY